MVAAGDETQGQRETWLVGAGGVLHNSWAIWKTVLSSIHWIHSAGGKKPHRTVLFGAGEQGHSKGIRSPKERPI